MGRKELLKNNLIQFIYNTKQGKQKIRKYNKFWLF